MLSVSSSSYPPLIFRDTEEGPNLLTQAWDAVTKVILSHGWPIESVDKSKFTPLTAAIKMNDLKLCKTLLDLKWPIHSRDEKFEFSALHDAITSGFNEIALYLIEKGADLNLKAENGMSYLHLAVIEENHVVAESLIKMNPYLLEGEVEISNSNLSWSKFSGEPPLNTIRHSPLSLAMTLPNDKNGQQTAVFLIKQGATVSRSTPAGFTYIHLAAARGYDEVCQLLISKGMDINAVCNLYPDFSGNIKLTPVLYAVVNKQIKTTQLLLDHNASYQTGKKIKESPFVQALKSGNENLIQLFIDKGEKLDQEDPYLGGGNPLLVTLLIEAPEEKKRPLFESFLRLGMKLDHRFHNQQTYLHGAVKGNHKWLCELLLEHGADINVVDSDQMNVLHYAANKNYRDLLSFLLLKGADARALDSSLFTPLMHLESDKLTFADECIDLKNADQGFSCRLGKLRMLGLRNSLSGKAFKGSVRFLAYLELGESLQSYLDNNSNLPAFLHSFPEMMKQSTYLSWEQAMSKINQGEIVTLSAGWSGHEISIVVSNTYIIIGNRGDHCGIEPGIKIFVINNPSHLADALKELIDNRDFVISYLQAEQQILIEGNSNTVFEQIEKMKAEAMEKHIEFFNKKLVELLDLKQIHYIRQREQITGNCTWMAAKMTLKGSLILHYLQEDPQLNIKEILPPIKKMTKGWSQYDIIQSLSILKQAESIAQLKKNIDFEAIYEELFAKHFFNEEVSKKLIEFSPRLENLKSNPNSNSFLYAYKHQKPKLIRWVLEREVQPKVFKFSDSTNLEVDAILLEYFIKGGVKSNFKDLQGGTPLDFFCSKTDTSAALKMLKAWKEECESTHNMEDLKTLINSTDELGFTPLMTLLLYSENLKSNKELIELLLQCGAEVDRRNNKGYPILYFALKKIKTEEDVEILRSFLTTGPNAVPLLNTPLFDGMDSLELALIHRNEILIKFLLDQGVKVSKRHMNELRFPDMDKTLFKYFLEKAFRLNLTDSDGSNVLHKLCQKNKDFALKLLKGWISQCHSLDDFNELKKIINAQTLEGVTPLIYLIALSDDLESLSELISLMIQYGADVSAIDIRKQNVFHYVINKIKGPTDLNIIKILLTNSEQASKALNTPNGHFDTPMYIIPSNAEWSMPLVKMFRDHGAV